MRFGFGFQGLTSPACFGGDSGGGGGGGQSNTVTQVQQIPQYQQDFSNQNMNLAQSLGSQPYPTYQAPIIAGLNGVENQGLSSAVNSAYNYQPELSGAQQQVSNTAGYNPLAAGDPSQSGLYGAAVNANIARSGVDATGNPLYGANATMANDPGNAGTIARYMSPYVQNALAPQLLQAQLTQDKQQQGINAGATSANAFGDSRQGVMNALQNYYGQQTNAGIEAQGFNTAYNSALNAALGEQGVMQNQQKIGQAQQGIGQAQQTINLNQQTAAQNYQKLQQQQQLNMLGIGQEQAAIAQQIQNQGLTGANAIYDVGKIQQDNSQAQLSAAYNQYMNQVNWPYAMLGVQESALSNNPYDIAKADTVPTPSSNTQGLSTFASLAGSLGSLAGSSK